MSENQKNELDDQELIESYKLTGDNQLIGLIFKKYSALVLGVSLKILKNKEESKDAVSEIFILLMQKLKDHEIKHFKSWLYRLTTNHCLMKLRKENPFLVTDIDSEINQKLFMEYPDMEHLFYEGQSEVEMLQEALQQLKGEQRECVELFYLKEKSYKEIAGSTGIEIQKVKSHIQNGKRNLKNILDLRKLKEI